MNHGDLLFKADIGALEADIVRMLGEVTVGGATGPSKPGR